MLRFKNTLAGKKRKLITVAIGVMLLVIRRIAYVTN